MREKAEALGIKVDGRWSDARIQQEIDKVENVQAEGADVNAAWDAAEVKVPPVGDNAVITNTTIHSTTEAVDKFKTLEWANERAAKIWGGQSVSLTILERVGRIKLALKERGFTRFDELVIPTTEDYKKYL